MSRVAYHYILHTWERGGGGGHKTHAVSYHIDHEKQRQSNDDDADGGISEVHIFVGG